MYLVLWGCLLLGGWCLLLGGCLLQGGVCSRGVCCWGGGCVAFQHALRQTPPLLTESQTPVKTLSWPNFVAAGNNERNHLCINYLHLFSHQLFHIAIMLCILYQMEGVFIDFLSRRPLVEARPTPTLTSSFAPVVLTIMAEAITIVGFWFYIKRNLLEKKTQQESQKNK